MKNHYFTPKTIRKKAHELFQKMKEKQRIHHCSFDPNSSALLILDMQNYFLDKQSHAFIPSAPAIIPGIQSLAQVFTKKGLPVILTQHGNTNANAGLMKTWWNDIISEDTPTSEIIAELQHPQNIVIKKTQYDGFYQTELDQILKKNNINQLVITGVMTHLCVETTVRSAFIRGYTVILPMDGTATYHESFHFATFLNVSHGFATPVFVDDILGKLGEDEK